MVHGAWYMVGARVADGEVRFGYLGPSGPGPVGAFGRRPTRQIQIGG